LKVSFVKIVFSVWTNYETLPLACFGFIMYFVLFVESCACQLYIKRIYDDDDASRPTLLPTNCRHKMRA